MRGNQSPHPALPQNARKGRDSLIPLVKANKIPLAPRVCRGLNHIPCTHTPWGTSKLFPPHAATSCPDSHTVEVCRANRVLTCLGQLEIWPWKKSFKINFVWFKTKQLFHIVVRNSRDEVWWKINPRCKAVLRWRGKYLFSAKGKLCVSRNPSLQRLNEIRISLFPIKHF